MRQKLRPRHFIPAILLSLPALSTRAAELMPAQSAKVALGNLPMRAMWAIESNDLKTLANLAHSNGIRFSYDVYADDADVTLKPAQIRQLGKLPPRYWGSYSEAGDPVKSSWADYRHYHLWKRDFSTGKLSFNTFVKRGNKINNLRDAYTDAIFVEAYLAPKPYVPGKFTKENIWAGLWMIWKREGKQWKLRGLARDEPAL